MVVDTPSLDLSPVVPANYCLHTDCASEVMDLRAAVREASADRWRAVATAKLLREKLLDLKRVVMTGQAGGGDVASALGVNVEKRAVIRKALEVNPLFLDSGYTDMGAFKSQQLSEMDERGQITKKAQYMVDFVEHYEYRQSVDEMADALYPVFGICLVALLSGAGLQMFAQWRRSYTPYTRRNMRSGGDAIAEHPSRTRSQCRKRCDRDRNCVAFAMPVAGPDHRSGQPGQRCATLRRFSHAPVPYDHRLDVDPGAGWVTWTKHDMTFEGCPPQGCDGGDSQ